MPEFGLLTAWHGRLMVLAWLFLFPFGILIARFFKVTPRQNWPTQLDNPTWWYSHLLLQYLGGLSVLVALMCIELAPADPHRQWLLHRVLGWLALALCAVQFIGGWFRGSKGGPTDPRPDGSHFGDHYCMTFRRRLFEAVHKRNGYLAISVAWVAVFTGLVAVHAPAWMVILIVLWCALCAIGAVGLHATLQPVDTYAAIWGKPAPNSTQSQ